MGTRNSFLILATWIAVTLLTSGPASLYPQGGSRIFTTQISQDLSVVCEITPSSPYAGQQFSIIYSLHALKFPVAVDIEPQQYSHFWTEIIPLSNQPRTVTRIINGRPRHEFLLRQVIAYPLSSGNLELPPLALKIKMTGNLAAGSENWDLIAETKADLIRVKTLPLQASTAYAAFTGNMTGQWSEFPTAQGQEIHLEVRGNANLAFFRPQDWAHIRGGSYQTPRLMNAESEVQTKDLGGSRRLSVVHSQRWSIRIFPSGQEPVRMEDLVVPLFEPETGAWSRLRIPGFSLRAASAPVTNDSVRKAQPVATDKSNIVARYLPWFFGLAAIVALILWLIRKRKDDSRFQIWVNKEMSNLRKQSGKAPRSFIETAHRVLQRYADEHNLRMGHENTAFHQCWSQVERSRFVAEEPSSEEQSRLLQAIQDLLIQDSAVERDTSASGQM